MGMQIEMLEAYCVPDTFVSGLGSVEDVGGGCWRFTFYTRQGSELVVAARLIMPGEALPHAIHMSARLTHSCACQTLLGMTPN